MIFTAINFLERLNGGDMKKELNVLSIDYDFFQTVDIDTLATCYPDGHDLPTEIANVIWATYYAASFTRRKLEKVGVDAEKLNELRHIIMKNADRNPPKAMITNSHVCIFDFIMDEYKRGGYKRLNLVNIDMHHDMFNENETLDCGNWVSHIVKEIPKTRIKWISNPVSKEAYGLTDRKFEIIENDFKSIRDKKWDLVFLCRSDIWTPPHLDKEFIDIANLIMETSAECRYMPVVMTSRYEDETFLNVVEEHKKFYPA